VFAFRIANTLIHASRADNTRSPRRVVVFKHAPAGTFLMFSPFFNDGVAYCLVVHTFVKEITDEVYDMLRQLHSDYFERQR